MHDAGAGSPEHESALGPRGPAQPGYRRNAAAICAPAPDMSCRKTRIRRRSEDKGKVYRIRHGLRRGRTAAGNGAASLTSALILSDYGCFVPDLTRFAAGPCEGARQVQV